MPAVPKVDPHGFKRILYRNIALPLIVGVISVVAFVALIAYLLSAMRWVEHSDRVIAGGQLVARLAVDQETGMRGFFLTGDEAYLEPYRAGMPRMQAELDALTRMVDDEPRQRERLQLLARLHGQWTEFANQAITLRRNNGDWLDLVTSGRGKQEFDQLRREFNAFLETEETLRTQRSNDARRLTLILVLVYLGVNLLLAGGLAWFGRRELMRLSESYGAALDRQNEHGRLLERQAWLRSAQTGLAERIVGQQALAPLARGVLDFLGEHLGVAVAALYVREPVNLLRRVATYGFSKESERSDALIGAGEGLLGQALLGRRVIHLDSLPADYYLKVSSGLGSGAPVSVLLAPIEEGGVVNGVLELGFARPVESRDLEFLELVGASIGAAIEAAQYRQRLQAALADTQQLNEELQVQQEELRTANEGLEEQARLLRESRASLENQQAELEQTNVRLGEQAESLDQKNAALQQAQAALEARADELQRASRYKSEFLANMSHELRTPLNSSLILARLLGENKAGNLSAEQVKFAESIYASGNDLLALINDILDISKVEAGQLELAPEAVTADELVASLKRTFLPLAKEKGLALDVPPYDIGPAPLFTDRQRLEQILKNLLSNAIKFTGQGSVSLELTALPDDRIRFSVADTGIGIEPSQLDIVFDAFRQADGGTSRRYGGTGLGLSISRELATLLGGTIAVSSTVGKGSTFTLTVPRRIEAPAVAPAPAALPARTQDPSTPQRPLAPPAAPPAPVPSATTAAASARPAAAPFPDDRAKPADDRRTVLVVEDEPAFAGILYDLARELGYRCLVAQGADEGLQLAREFLPGAVLLDMRLPDRPGLSLLQDLKEDLRTRHIPVHVVSSEDRSEAALHMGAIGYAQKPASRDALKDVFRRLEERTTKKMKRILLVEDDARQRDSVTHLISDEDVDIVAVATGAEALARLGQTGEGAGFDCMIIDLKLPDMQGKDLLRRMAEQGLQPFPPVIVYTGRNLTREEEADLMKYSRSIIIKGARSPERLLDEVTLFLHKVESTLSDERKAMLKTVRSRDHVFQGRRVLLVDDDVRNIFALTSALEQKGLAVTVARNGQEAIDRLDETPDIDLVLMDVMMPVMDGLEATRRLRADARFQKLPIIAVTAKAMRDDHDQCLKAGASDYLSKPVDLERLFALLKVWLPAIERLPA